MGIRFGGKKLNMKHFDFLSYNYYYYTNIWSYTSSLFESNGFYWQKIHSFKLSKASIHSAKATCTRAKCSTACMHSVWSCRCTWLSFGKTNERVGEWCNTDERRSWLTPEFFSSISSQAQKQAVIWAEITTEQSKGEINKEIVRLYTATNLFCRAF